MNLLDKFNKFIRDNNIKSYSILGDQLIIKGYCKITNLTIPVKFDVVGHNYAEVYITNKTIDNLDFNSIGVIVNFRKDAYDFKGLNIGKNCYLSFSKDCVVSNLVVDLNHYPLGVTLRGCVFNNSKIINYRKGESALAIYSSTLNNCEFIGVECLTDRCKINNLRVLNDSGELRVIRVWNGELNNISFDEVESFEVYNSFITLTDCEINSKYLYFDKVDFGDGHIVFNSTLIKYFKRCTYYKNLYFNDVSFKELLNLR